MRREKILIPGLAALAVTLAIGGPAMAGGYSGRSDWKENVLSLRPWPDPGQAVSQDMARRIRWAGPGATASDAVWATSPDAVQAISPDAGQATTSDAVRTTSSDTVWATTSDAGWAVPSGTDQAISSGAGHAVPADAGLVSLSDAGRLISMDVERAAWAGQGCATRADAEQTDRPDGGAYGE